MLYICFIFRDEEGAEHLRKRNMKLPFMFATGEAVLYEVSFPMSSLVDPSQLKNKSTTGKGAKATLHNDSVDPNCCNASFEYMPYSIP